MRAFMWPRLQPRWNIRQQSIIAFQSRGGVRRFGTIKIAIQKATLDPCRVINLR